MLKKYWMPLVALAVLVWSTLAFLDVYVGEFSFLGGFLRTSTGMLLGFMVIIIIRYLLLLLFSYLNYARPHVVDPELQEFPLVTILVPAYNEQLNITAAMKSVLAINYPNMEILVLDDGSTDDTAALASHFAGRHPHAQVTVHTAPNAGKANALNRGVELSKGEFLLCMDADAVLAPDVIRQMLPHFQDPEVGAIAGNVKVSNRDTWMTRLQALEYVVGQNTIRRAQSYFDCVNVVPGTLGMFRRSALKAAGGYDHSTYAEDTDLTIKLLGLGWKVQCAPHAYAWTEAPETVTGVMRQRYRWTRGILQTVFKNKHLLWRMDIKAAALWLLAFESVIWPPMNMFANFFFLFVACTQQVIHPIILWWIQLTILDIITALHCIVMDDEWLSLVPYTIVFRLVFVVIIDVCKTFSIAEEYLGIAMNWDQVARKGKAAVAGVGV